MDMGLTQTTLNGAVTASQRTVKLTAYTAPALGTGVNSGNKVLRMDGELCYITDDSLSPVLQVVRGEIGTGAAAHNTLATVAYGLSTDFTQSNSIAGANIGSYGADGAITITAIPS